MPYSTIAEIQKRISPALLYALAKEAESEDTLDEVRLNTAIADADSLIDDYLDERYVVPISPAPQRLIKLSVDIAVFFLHQIHQEAEMPKVIQTRYDEAINALEKLRSGELSLAAGEIPASKLGIIRTNKTAEDKFFSPEMLAKII